MLIDLDRGVFFLLPPLPIFDLLPEFDLDELDVVTLAVDIVVMVFRLIFGPPFSSAL